MSKSSFQNLYCLIVMSLTELEIVMSSEVSAAIIMCEECKSQLKSNTLCFKLLTDVVNKVNLWSLPGVDWLVNQVFQKVLFFTTFMPLISPNTPLYKGGRARNGAGEGIKL